MLNKIKDILSNYNDISAWKINESSVEAEELFFVKKSLDMNRSKKVQHIKVTIYRDFEESGTKYRGSSTIQIHPTMSEEEIVERIKDGSLAASFVKNEYYPLVSPSEEKTECRKSNFCSADLGDWMPLLAEAVYKADTYEAGWINSAEIFLNNVTVRIINSLGVDVSFTKYAGQIEFITTWKGDSEEVELYKYLEFSDFRPEEITKAVDGMLQMCRNKALAKKTPDLKKGTVILTGEAVAEFFGYYYGQADAYSVYNNISTLKVKDNVQGENIKGDTIDITLDPQLANSTGSSPCDEDGLSLKPVKIYTDGVLERYFGSTRFSHYIGTKSSGNIANLVVKGGSKTLEELKREPYLEILAFSDFQMDSLTGDFAGEIRLGWYYDGTEIVPVTGGSISSNIKEVHKDMWLSQEVEQHNNFMGPKAIKLHNVAISGA
jgi:predicted Zn-dependent protease